MNCDRIPGAKHIPSSQNSFAYFFLQIYITLVTGLPMQCKAMLHGGADMPIYIYIFL